MKIKTKPRPVNFAGNQWDFEIALLGSLGMSTRYIQQRVGLTPCQITYRLHAARIKRADYRNGEGLFGFAYEAISERRAIRTGLYEQNCRAYDERMAKSRRALRRAA